MGNDLAIVNSARVSYLSESKGQVKDKKLLFYLLKNKHTSPFEMVEFKFHIKCPLFIARQWMRHRTWSYNEVSRRYTDSKVEFYIPDVWRKQSTVNKQGSEQGHVPDFTQQLNRINKIAIDTYNNALTIGVAREQARIFLPQGMYTEFIAKVDAHNLMHFLKLRMKPNAQREIQLYAETIFETFLTPILPWTAEAFEKYVLNTDI